MGYCQINLTRPVIGEEVEECKEETMSVVETLMVESEEEEWPAHRISLCHTGGNA